MLEYQTLTMSNTVKIVSVNCQCLSDPRKRRHVFHYLRQKPFAVYLLHNTHPDPKIKNCVQAERGNKSYFASYSSNSRGVAILFKNNTEFSVEKKCTRIFKETTYFLLEQ